MKLLAPALLALAACAAKPAPAPIAQTCPAAPRYLTADDLHAFGERENACRGDEACIEAIHAEYADAVVSMSTIIDIGKQHAATRSAGGDHALDELRAIETKACACRDTDCVNGVQLEFEDWAKRYADTQGTQAEADQAGKIAENISECMMKALTGSTP